MTVRVERNGPVTTVVLSRPEARNAVNTEHAQALVDTFTAFENDPEQRVAVFWGEGGTFCAGGDLKEVQATGATLWLGDLVPPDDDAAPAPNGPMGPSRLELTKPVIAAVSGPLSQAGWSSRCGPTSASSRTTRSSASTAVAGASRRRCRAVRRRQGTPRRLRADLTAHTGRPTGPAGVAGPPPASQTLPGLRGPPNSCEVGRSPARRTGDRCSGGDDVRRTTCCAGTGIAAAAGRRPSSGSRSQRNDHAPGERRVGRERSVRDRRRHRTGSPVTRARRVRPGAPPTRGMQVPAGNRREPTPRWRAEAAALNRFDHAHLVRLLDGGEAEDEAFLVLPLMTESLAARLDSAALSRDDAASVVLALADALGHVHRAGVVHGGVDADGVLLDPYGRPCWSGLPDPTARAARRAVDEDLYALAVLAVRCVTGDGSGRTAPTAVLDAVRAAADEGRAAAGMRRRLSCSLESVAPLPSRRGRVAHVAERARLRGRPGFAAALAAAFAASVLGTIVVGGNVLPALPVDALDAPSPATVLADPAGSDVATSVQGALDRLGVLAAEPPPPAPAVTREPPLAPVAEDGDAGDRPTASGSERSVAQRPAGDRPDREEQKDGEPSRSADRNHGRDADEERHDPDEDGADDDRRRGLVGSLLSALL